MLCTTHMIAISGLRPICLNKDNDTNRTKEPKSEVGKNRKEPVYTTVRTKTGDRAGAACGRQLASAGEKRLPFSFSANLIFQSFSQR